MVALAEESKRGKVPTYLDKPAWEAPLPEAPTIAAPGTPEKEIVFKDRARRKVQLHHPYDARFEGDDTPLLFIAGLLGIVKPNAIGTSRRGLTRAAMMRQAMLEEAR